MMNQQVSARGPTSPLRPREDRQRSAATRRLLVPVDFSSCSRAALEHAANLAARVGAAIDILHVWPAQEPPASSSASPVARLALARVALALEDLRVSLPPARDSRIRIGYGPAAEAIVRVAAEGYEVVVMGWHGTAEQTSLGSVAAKVRAEAPCPVLTIHPDLAPIITCDSQERSTP